MNRRDALPDAEDEQAAIERYVDRFGGRKEGVIRNDIVMDGEPRNSVRYSISQAKWAANA